MHTFAMYLLITLGMSMVPNSLLANPDLPSTYPLKNVIISILHQTSHSIPGGYQVTLSGDGNSFYSRNGEHQQPLAVDKNILLELVNDFYQIHFFELADTYSVKKQVILKDDSTVASIAMKLLDTTNHKVCIQLADYQKCITVINYQPTEAAQLVKKIEGLFIGR